MRLARSSRWTMIQAVVVLYLLAAGMVLSGWWTMQAFSMPILAVFVLCVAMFRVALSAQRALLSDRPAIGLDVRRRTSWLAKFDLDNLRKRPISTLTAMAGAYFGVAAVSTGLFLNEGGAAISAVLIQLFIAVLAIPLYGAASTGLEDG
ncbi:hypothetical protein DXT87_09995 [Arthrobacter sp. AET 35A]|nr:hypothetical protein [Arthrobacter sp. AET 35A]